MTPADLAAWRAHMAYTQRQAAAALGITLATYQRLERGAEWSDGAAVTIDRRTALACAAIAAGLAEWAPASPACPPAQP
jgi:DNA-binding XRE family transcriptional regulator